MAAPQNVWQGATALWYQPSMSMWTGFESLNVSPNEGWTLTVFVAGPTAGFDATVTPQGEGWYVRLSDFQTADLTAGGSYRWSARATNGTDTLMIASGTFVVFADPNGALAGFETRSQTQIDLEACQAAIRSRLNGGGVAEYTIGGRRLRYETLTELRAMETALILKFNREKRAEAKANGLPDRRTLYVRF